MRLRALLTILALTVCARGVGAQESPLGLQVATPQPLNVSGRAPLSFALVVHNSGPVDRTLHLDMNLPVGWRLLAIPDPFDIASGESSVRIVGVLVPSIAPAGTYLVGCRVTDASDPAIAAACDVHIEVAPETALSMRLLSGKEFALAGTAYEVTFSLANTGNIDLGVSLVITGSSFPTEIHGFEDSAAVVLPAGASREVTIVVKTNTSLPRAVENTVSLSARPSREGGEAVPLPGAVSAMATTEVIPPASSGGSIMHHLPITTETTATLYGDGMPLGSLAETLTATGTLDEEGRHAIEAKMHKVLATDEDLLFNTEDRYSLAYRYGFTEVLLLDHVYDLSPLLVSNQTGRGVQATASTGAFRFSGLYYRDIWASGQPQGLGGGLGFAIPGSGTLESPLYGADLNVFSHLTGTTGFDLWQRFKPGPWLEAQLDAALQLDAAGTLVPALFAEAKGTLEAWSYQAWYLRVWTGFDGPNTDTQYFGANVGVRLLDRLLAIQGSGSLSDSNLLLDPGLLVAPRALRASLGANGKIPAWKADTRFDWIGFWRTDRLLPAGNGSIENVIRVGWNQTFGSLSLQAGATFDEWIELEGGSPYIDQTDSVSLEWRRTPQERYGLTVDYTGRWSVTAIDQHEPGLGLSARFNWDRSGLNLNAHASAIFDEVEWLGMSASLDAAFRHTFAWGHTLSTSAGGNFRSEAGVPSSGYSFSLSYRAPANLPLSRKKDTAIVRGTVIRGENGVPVQGAILRLNGLAAVSGARGEFAFYLPKSGTHYLQVDAGSLGAHLIPVQTMPLEIASPPGSDTTIHVILVEGSSVTGTVNVYGFPNSAAVFGTSSDSEPGRERLGGLANVVVELSGNGKQKRRVTGADGRFSFEQVSPGSYTLEVLGGRIPSYHTVEEPSRLIVVRAGEPTIVEVRVLQDRRAVQFMETDFTTVAEETPRASREVTLSLPGAKPEGKAGSPEAASAPGATTTPAPDSTAVARAESPAAVHVEPAPLKPGPVESAPVEPASIAPAPVETPVQPSPGERHVAPDTPSHEALIMAAQAGFNAPAPTWDDILSVWLAGPITATEPPKTSTAGPPTTAPTAAVPAAPVPAVPPATVPAAKVPAAKIPAIPSPAPTKPVPVPPAPAPTPPPITIPIPLPMPTPRPPVTVPVPTPTPTPFPP